MIDLSNNNATGHDFSKAFVKGGQRHVYLKRCEGTGFVDTTYPTMRKAALAAHLKVGAYNFLHPGQASPEEAATFFTDLLELPLKPGIDLRPCLDVESGTPDASMGAWVSEVASLVKRNVGCAPLIYGSGFFLQSCAFRSMPGPLWIAAYGRNDGKEYPVNMVPAPWKSYAAHQYTSEAHVVGINGACDLSHVFVAGGVEVPKSAAV